MPDSNDNRTIVITVLLTILFALLAIAFLLMFIAMYVLQRVLRCRRGHAAEKRKLIFSKGDSEATA
ncbi:hypothetical protein HD806DRAFT_541973 [Xylariaceae sp. AK1471]|nr:hypothetical protein HD806DRAFT_541973 [Xylariaceae sp. AK1471]